MVRAPKISLSSKNAQIEKASSHVFIAVAIASVIVSFCLVILNLLWSQAQFNMRVQAEKEAARDTLISNVERSEALLIDYESFQSADDIVENQGDKSNTAVVLDALPSSYNFPAVASAVQNLAESSDVSLTNFDGTDDQASAEQTSADPSPVEIQFSAGVEGNYNDVRRFITGLERSIRPIIVTNMNISGNDANLQLNLEAYTYYQPALDLSLTTKEIQ